MGYIRKAENRRRLQEDRIRDRKNRCVQLSWNIGQFSEGEAVEAQPKPTQLR